MINLTQENDKPKNEIPLGLGMAFSQNQQAMNYFSSLPEEEQKAVVDKAKSVKSKIEMQQFVSGLSSNEQPK